MTEQQIINALLTEYINTGSSTKLEKAFTIGLFPDSSLDLIDLAANLTESIGDGRIAVLTILIRFLSPQESL